MAKPRIVSQETRERQSKAAKQRYLTLKQERFAKAYATLGNGRAAAEAAGYSDSSNDVLRQQAAENLAKPHVAAAVRAEIVRVEEKIAFDAGRVRSRLDQLSRAAEGEGQFGVAVRAEELIGRAAGMFVDQSITLTGNLSADHLAALVEVARKRQAEPIQMGNTHARARLLDE